MEDFLTKWIDELENRLEYIKRTYLTKPGIVNNIFKRIEKLLGVDRIYMIYAILGFLAVTVCCICIDSIAGAPLVCNFIGFAYPLYATCREKKHSDIYNGLIFYWTLFACFVVTDSISGHLMFLFPFYWFVKLIILFKAFTEIVGTKFGEDLAALLENVYMETGLHEGYILFGVIMIVPRYLVFGCNANIFCNSLGLLYPVIVTYKEMKLLPLKGEKKNMLNYWVIYSCICVGDFFSKFIASWYWLVKFVFLTLVFYYNFRKYEEKPEIEILSHKKKTNITCVICFVNHVNRSLDPCGHAQFCERCTDNLKTGDPCYICQTPIHRKITIYLP